MDILTYHATLTVCTSYYTPAREYHIYCLRPEGTKRPRASAVNAILPREGRVVTGLSQNKRSDKFAELFEGISDEPLEYFFTSNNFNVDIDNIKVP